MKFKHIALGIVLILGVTSCNKDEDTNPPPITKANILGSVNLYDDGVSQTENSGMVVKIEGSEITATTNTEGEFILTDVPFGTYTLVYEKTGYGTYKKFDIEHKNTGSSTIISAAPSLGQTSTTAIANLTISSSSEFPVIISATTNPSASLGNTRYIRFFLSTDPSVSHENYDNAIETFQVNISPYNFNLSQATIDALGYSSGTIVYAKCYGESYFGNNYSDPNLAKDIFPNLNMTSATAVSFTIP